MTLLHCVEIEALEIEVLCSEQEWEHSSSARDITIEDLQFQGRVESYIIWDVPVLEMPSRIGTICVVYV